MLLGKETLVQKPKIYPCHLTQEWSIADGADHRKNRGLAPELGAKHPHLKKGLLAMRQFRQIQAQQQKAVRIDLILLNQEFPKDLRISLQQVQKILQSLRSAFRPLLQLQLCGLSPQLRLVERLRLTNRHSFLLQVEQLLHPPELHLYLRFDFGLVYVLEGYVEQRLFLEGRHQNRRSLRTSTSVGAGRKR